MTPPSAVRLTPFCKHNPSSPICIEPKGEETKKLDSFTSQGQPSAPDSKIVSVLKGLFLFTPFSATGCVDTSSQNQIPNTPSSDAGSPDIPLDLPSDTPVVETTSTELVGFEPHATTPCGPDGVLTDLDEGLGVCANYQSGEHHLFSWDPQVKESASSLVSLSNPPDQVLENGSEIYITTHENPGITVVNLQNQTEKHYPFPAVTLNQPRYTSSDQELVTSLTPAYPKGLAKTENQVFVATANLLDSEKGDFRPGTVLALDSSGHFKAIETFGYNPTGIAVLNDRLFVVSTGAYDKKGQALTDSFLEIYDPISHERLEKINLGKSAAGISGEINVSDDRKKIILPTGNNSGDLLVVDLESLQVTPHSLKNSMASQNRIFFSGLQLTEDGRYSLVNNFNDGQSYLVDLNTGKLVGAPLSIDPDLTDANGLGDTVRVGKDFYLGLGGQIMQVRTTE